MTPEAQRIAIAEACGWIWKKRQGCPLDTCFLFHPETKPRFDGKCHWLGNVAGTFETCEKPKKTNNAFGEPAPDYLNDLNAMHEAEKVLTGIKCDAYAHYLGNHCNRSWHATAAQRAEAFLRTLNLWKE